MHLEHEKESYVSYLNIGKHALKCIMTVFEGSFEMNEKLALSYMRGSLYV